MVLFIVTGGGAWADPVTGVWRTQAGQDGGFGHVEISPCSGLLCGRVMGTFDAAGRAVEARDLGRVILRDLAAAGGGLYRDGRITNPETDRDYAARLQLSGDRLEVSGCIMTICRSAGTWQRVR